MNTLRGTQLTPEDQRHVLAAYVYRCTVENAKANPRAVKATGSTLPLILDSQWLEVTSFAVTQAGRLDKRVRSCFTHNHEIPAHKAILDDWAQKRAALYA